MIVTSLAIGEELDPRMAPVGDSVQRVSMSEKCCSYVHEEEACLAIASPTDAQSVPLVVGLESTRSHPPTFLGDW